MKKIYGFIAIIILLSLLLSGCNNGTKAAGQTTEISTTNTEDEPMADLPENIYGTLTNEYYINKWAGLFLDLSENYMNILMQPGTIDARNTASDYFGEGAVLDMSVYKWVNDDDFAVEIYISDTNGKTLEECIAELVKFEEKRYKKNNIVGNFDKMETVGFCGEQYMPLHVWSESTHVTYGFQTYEVPPEDFWYLCRIKEEKLITIKCTLGFHELTPDSNTLEDVLPCFKAINEVVSIDDYKVKEKPNYSEEQLVKLILKTLSEEEIDFYKSPTYDECICRLFKDFTWTYTSLPGYDYLYVATFTGTYYSNPRSYYDLGENTAHGSLSLLIDIRDKEDVEGSVRLRGYYDNYDQTERIIDLFCNLIVDCPQRT